MHVVSATGAGVALHIYLYKRPRHSYLSTQQQFWVKAVVYWLQRLPPERHRKKSIAILPQAWRTKEVLHEVPLPREIAQGIRNLSDSDAPKAS